MWQRKGKLALQAKAMATHVAKLWKKLWQGLKTGRVSGKSLGKTNRDGTLHGHMILYVPVGLHKQLLTLCLAYDNFQSDGCGVIWSNFVLRNWCAYSSLGQQLPFGCVLVKWFSVPQPYWNVVPCWRGTEKVLSNILPRQLPTCRPSRNKVDFCKNKH